MLTLMFFSQCDVIYTFHLWSTYYPQHIHLINLFAADDNYVS